MLNFEFVGNIETLRSIGYITADHVGAGIALLLSGWNSYGQKQRTFDDVQMGGECCGFDSMGNPRKNLLVSQIFNPVSDGKKLVWLGDGIFDRRLCLDDAVLWDEGCALISYHRGPVERYARAVALS